MRVMTLPLVAHEIHPALLRAVGEASRQSATGSKVTVRVFPDGEEHWATIHEPMTADQLWSALEDEAAPFGEQQIHSFSLVIDRGHVERALARLGR